MSTVYVGADHGGWHLASQLVAALISGGHTVYNLSNPAYDAADDYPLVSFRVAEALLANLPRDPLARGVLLCKSSGGVVVAANKVPGIRAVSVYTPAQAQRAAAHDHAHIIGLPALELTTGELWDLVQLFLEQPWDMHERHVRRVQQITEYENRER